MAISLGDNLNLSGALPDFTRQEYATLSAMKSVRDNRMPEMYLAYCLETHAYYYYNKQNEVDPITGHWRQFIGIDTVVSVMPAPSSEYANVLVQYIGATTQDYTKGYFYGIVIGTGDIVTVDAFKALIGGQSTTVTLDYFGDTSVVKAFENSGTDYFVYNNVIYSGVPSAGVIEFDPDTATSYTTDEAVAALNISGTTYAWENVPVSPGGSVDDKLTWGTEMPSTPTEDDVFLYMGETTYTYEEVTPVGDENPSELGWYVEDGSGGYELTSDTTVQSGTTYYTRAEQYVAGTIYQYDGTEWVAKTASGEPESIPVADVEAMFD